MMIMIPRLVTKVSAIINKSFRIRTIFPQFQLHSPTSPDTKPQEVKNPPTY